MFTSTTSGSIYNGYTTGPWTETYRTVDGSIVHREYNPDILSSTIDIHSTWPTHPMTELDWYKLNGIDIKSEEEIPEMKTYDDYDPKSFGRRYAVACNNETDLRQERVLKSISMMKSRLMMKCAPVKVENIECKMTPAVKENIIMAYKKLSMYGKKTPFVARFDEYGRRLPDEIKIDTLHGMTIQIINPENYGPYYLEFEGVIHDLFRKPEPDNTDDDMDVPF